MQLKDVGPEPALRGSILPIQKQAKAEHSADRERQYRALSGRQHRQRHKDNHRCRRLLGEKCSHQEQRRQHQSPVAFASVPGQHRPAHRQRQSQRVRARQIQEAARLWECNQRNHHRRQRCESRATLAKCCVSTDGQRANQRYHRHATSQRIADIAQQLAQACNHHRPQRRVQMRNKVHRRRRIDRLAV